MKTELSTVRKLYLTEITEPRTIDPVTVYLEDLGPGRGKITIECFGQSWSSFWPAMGKTTTITEFFLRCDEHYLMKNLSRIPEEIDDFTGLVARAREYLIERRKDGEIARDYTRDLYDECSSLGDAEGFDDLNDDFMQEVFGDEWWEEIPQKENPRYRYLADIVAVVKLGLQEVCDE